MPLFRDSNEAQEASHKKLRYDAVLLSRHRSLGRDIDDHVVEPQAFSRLAGDIEIDDSRSRAEIYADIVFRCAKLLLWQSNHTL